VPGLMSAWTYGAAILTFVFPMILFLAVALALYVVFTKPSAVPGHGEEAVERPIGWTPRVRLPARGQPATGYAPATGRHSADAPAGSQPTAPGGGQAAGGGGAAAGSGGAADPGYPAAGPGSAEGAE
jgi:hypothetical protein